MAKSSNDSFIESYLGDFFSVNEPSDISDFKGEADSKVADKAIDLEMSGSDWLDKATIAPKFSLIPTLSFESENVSKKIRSQPEAMLILMHCLYFLRRPMSAQLRRCFLKTAETMLDDYSAARWQVTISGTGVMSEARR